MTGITDAAGHTWQYSYDLRGHKLTDVDPDKGTTTMTYTAAGDVETSSDGRGTVVAYTYDAIGRKTSLRDGSVTGAKRAEWFYDTLSNGTVVNGQLGRMVRYDGADAYVEDHLGFTADYKPTSVKYTIPDSGIGAGVGGAYAYVFTYNQDGSTATTRLPALGDPGLGLETLTHGYNSLAKPSSLSTSLGATLPRRARSTPVSASSPRSICATTPAHRPTSPGPTIPARAAWPRYGPPARPRRPP
jgi:YD repeat-containing protein